MIFINYRIKDSIDLVTLLYDRLVKDFGEENVFWDKENLQAGHWPKQLEDAVRQRPVMLSVIGPQWDKVQFGDGPKAGHLRLSDSKDWVRKEITLALTLQDTGHKVIPVLLNGRYLPSKEWLKNVKLGGLFDCQSKPLRSAPDFNHDYEVLRDFIMQACPALKLKSAVSSSTGPVSEKPLHRPCHLPYGTLGELFIGRDDFLAELRAKFTVARQAGRWPRHVVRGVGGLGKTQAAVEYAYRHRDDYTAILMVSGDTPQSLQAGLAQVAGALYSNIDPATTDDIRERATLEWLSKNSGWLLIVDNADSQAARDGIVERFSQWANGHVLITARFQSWPHSVEPVDMHVLSPEMGARFLLRSTDGKRQSAVDDEQQARELAEKDLDGLCLALEQAAAYIAEREISLAEYRQRWAKNERQARTWADKWMMQYHTEREVSLSVATTWITTFEELPEASKQLLRMLSWLSPEPIPRGLLESCSNTIRLTPDARPSSSPLPPGEGPGVRVPEKERTVADPNATIDVEVALAALRRFSLLERRPGDPADSVGRIHRVVQLITREALDQTAQRTTLTAMLASVNEYTPTDCYDFRTWSVLEPLHLHLTVITALAEQANIAEPTSRLLSILGGFLEGKARYAEAEPLMRRALAIDEQSLGPDHPDVAIDLNNLAQLLQATNRLAEAEPLMRRALAIDEQSLWPDHPNVAIHLNNLALLLQATDRLAEAEP